jgi:hypothetical protein
MQLPIWLMTILFALAIGGAVGGIYWLMQTTPASRQSGGKGPTPIPAVESPAAKPGAKTNPLQKYIEDPLSEALIRGTVQLGSPIEVTMDGDRPSFRSAVSAATP